MFKSIAKISLNVVIVFIIAYVYMYFSNNLHISEELFFKLVAITFTFSNIIIIALKIFFEKNNHIDIDLD